jgi:iron(III) transport system substrate-binding protein
VLLTVDISRLEDAVQAGITQPLGSAAIEKTVPAQYRDAEGHWAGVSMRARVVYASKARVPQDAITYEELADPKWKGKICIRSGQHMYNNALFAAMIAKHGEAKAEEWLKGLKANLAQKPSGGDRETARDILAGKCDLGIANTYYWALMNDRETERKPWAEATKVILPTFQGGGTHVNLSGVAIIKTAPNKANAQKFVEWMTGEKAQQMHADLNYEYPVRADIAINKTIAGYGALKADPMPLTAVAANRKKASALVDKVGFDN